MHAPPPAVLAAELRARLDDNAVPGRAAGEKNYLRSDLHHIGVPLPAMRGVVRSFTKQSGRGLGHAELIDLVTDLWAQPVHEHRSTALLLLDAYAPLLRPDDTTLLEDLLRTCATWAHTDLLAPFVAGRLLLRHPQETTPAVRRWTADEAQWVRRGGILCFIPALRGEDTFTRWFPLFTATADPLLHDDRFFVRKAIGWALREGTKHHPAAVTGWLTPRLSRASSLTVREALKRLPDDARAPLLAAHAAAHPRRGRRPAPTRRPEASP
ncbi:DNA alkylation repair protein [Streptomyces sp. NPDC057746]|uniref:DNA alkylation repair protein n=1 Tax=Streptomyces sp. NPDC057746 TaxID=3346237 RepID=UPI00369BFC95